LFRFLSPSRPGPSDSSFRSPLRILGYTCRCNPYGCSPREPTHHAAFQGAASSSSPSAGRFPGGERTGPSMVAVDRRVGRPLLKSVTGRVKSNICSLPEQDVGIPRGLDSMPPGPQLGAILSSIDIEQLEGRDAILFARAQRRQISHEQARRDRRRPDRH